MSVARGGGGVWPMGPVTTGTRTWAEAGAIALIHWVAVKLVSGSKNTDSADCQRRECVIVVNGRTDNGRKIEAIPYLSQTRDRPSGQDGFRKLWPQSGFSGAVIQVLMMP